MNEISIIENAINYLTSLGHDVDVEVPMPFGTQTLIADAVVYRVEENQRKPFIVVEVKSCITPSAIEQAKTLSMVAATPYFLLTDGVRYEWYKVDRDTGKHSPIDEIHATRSTNYSDLLPLLPGALEEILWTMFDNLRSAYRITDMLETILPILLAKRIDEEKSLADVNRELEFLVRTGESDKETYERIRELVKSHNEYLPVLHDLFLRMKPTDVASSVAILQSYSILHTPKYTFINELTDVISKILKQGRGDLIIPSTIIDFLIEIAEISENNEVLIPNCGPGTLISKIPLHSENIGTLEITAVERNISSYNITKLLIALIGLKNVNFVLGDYIVDLNELKDKKFDTILSLPPIGGKVTESKIINSFNFVKRSSPSESFYLERSIRQLKEGGRLVAIVPEGLLFREREKPLRQFLLDNTKIEAIISLPPEAFAPATRIRTSVLVLKKLKTKEKKQDVFLAVANSIGTKSGGKVSENDLLEILNAYREGRKSKIPLCHTTKISGDVDRLTVSVLLPDEQVEEYEGELIELGEIAEFISGTRERAFDKDKHSGENFRLLGIENIKKDSGELEEIKVIDAEDLPRRATQILKEGDIVLSSVRPKNKAIAILGKIYGDIVGTNSLEILRPRKNIPPYYLLSILRSDFVVSQMERFTKGATVPKINRSDLKKIKIPFPDLKTQSIIAEKTKRAYEKREELLSRADEILLDSRKEMHERLGLENGRE